MFESSTIFLFLEVVIFIGVSGCSLSFGWARVIVDLVNDVVAFVYMRNTIFVEFFRVLVHVKLDLLK